MVNGHDVAIVVGGSGAVGSAICEALLDSGLTVRATSTSSRRESRLAWSQWRVGERFPKEILCPSVGRLSAVFYCVGIASNKAPLLATTEREIIDLFTANAVGFVEVMKSLREVMVQSKTSVVAISSDATTSVSALNGPYSASKSALEVFARTMAIEEQANGIRVNIISPSLIESPMGDESLRRAGVIDVGEYKRALPGGGAIAPEVVAAAAVAVALGREWTPCSGQVFRLSEPPR